MSNITSTIPAFIGGVSQQSPALRLKTQCESLVNGHATVGDGLMKRPNADLISIIGSITAPTGIKTHKINRDVSEKYIVVMTTDSTNPIRVFELDGTEMTVRYGTLDADGNYSADSNVKKYLTQGGITDAKEQIKATTIADYTVIVNTKKVAAMSASVSAEASDLAFVHFKACHKGTYTITFGGSGGTDSQSVVVAYVGGVINNDSNAMAAAFATGGSKPDIAKWTNYAHNNVLRVAPAGAYNTVKVSVQDPFGGQDLIPINYCEVDGVDKLPAKMPSNITIKIGGDKDTNQDDYYMSYNSDTAIWSETIGFGLEYEFDTSTMPHRLVRTGTDEFTFAPILWEDRTVGDDDTNPIPSFIGNTISNTSFAKNRLWFYSKDNAIGSKAGDYFNFFASTVMDVLDNDPIDVAGTGEQVTNYRSGKPFDNGLLLFADEEQFALTSGDQLMTPKSVVIDPTTSYAADVYCDPLKLGADVYFVSPKGSYLSLRQYTIMPDTLMKDAYDVTSHVPKYIPQGNTILAGCNSLDIIFLHTSANPNSLYIHKFLWDGDKKAQQAWYEWEFSDDIYGIHTFGTALYVLFYEDTNGYRLEKIELENIPYTGAPFRYHLDSLMKLTGGSFDNTDTVFTMPMDVGDGAGYVVIDADDNTEVTAGFTLSGTTLTFEDADKSETNYFVGRTYEMRMRFSEWYMRDSEGNALIAGNLTVRTLTLSFKDTGSFNIEITPFARNTVIETLIATMSGVRVDESIIGAVTLLTGEETFLIMADSRRTIIELVTDSYLPVAIQLGCWEGTWIYRGKIT